MGYTTDFSGKFSLNKPAGDDLVELMSNMDDHPQGPGGYCQWILSKDRTAIEWDGGEKFYDFITWIRLVAKLAGEMGYSLTGKVRWSGEERQDKGEIIAADNIITWDGSGQNRGGESIPDAPKPPKPATVGVPFEDIQTLVSRCNDPQMPRDVQDAAAIVQEWPSSPTSTAGRE